MNLNNRFLKILLALITCNFLFLNGIVAQPERLNFERLSPGKGQASATIYSILQDKKGFMWFGSTDGLICYDGYKFKTYKHDSKDPHSISEDWVTSITEDKDGNLWIGVWEGGLNFYDRSQDKFYSYMNKPGDNSSIGNNTVWKVFIDRYKKIWAGTRGGGLNMFDPVKKTFKRFTNKASDSTSLSSNDISSIFEDSYGELWIGTLYNGLNRLNRNNNTFKIFKHEPGHSNSIASSSINEIWEDRKHNLWIGTSDHGISILSPDRQHFLNRPETRSKLTSNNIRSFYEDENNKIWIGTDGGGINIYDPKENDFTSIKNDPAEPGSISSNVAFSIYKSRDGIIWIGGYLSGLNIYDKNKQKFQTFSKVSQDGKGLSNHQINSVYDDSQGYLWIGTENGLNRFDSTTQTFRYYFHNSSYSKSISGDRVQSIYEDSYKNLWLGTIGGGLNLYQKDKDQFIHFKHNSANPASLTNDNVWSTLEDSKGNFWVSTYGGGLNLLNRSTMKFTPFWLKDSLNKLCPEIFTLCEDKKKGGLWIGSASGLVYFDPDKKQLKMYKHEKNDPTSLSSDEAVVIYQDSKLNLWIGTGTGKGGVDLYNPATDNFTSFKIENDFKNNTTTGIVEDSAHDLWVSTFRGISRLNTAKKNWDNYDIEDGLQSSQFIKGSYFKRKNGTIIFGSTDGITIIHPEEFESNHYVPNVVINKLLILNKEIVSGEKDSILKKVISETDKITLTHSQYVLTFEFAALSYSNSEKNEYAYKLENFEKDWNYIGTRRSATYTNLDPGKYIFRVKASNADGIWNEKGASVILIITPPFWSTWWFIMISMLCVTGAIVIIFILRNNAIKRHRMVLEQQVEERTEQLAHSIEKERRARLEAENAYRQAEHATHAKSIFLATMSHEIRTPMNGVIGMSSMLAGTPLTDVQRMYTETITTCCESLLNVINDILDFSKIESGNMELEQESFNLRKCVEDVLDIFGTKASEIGLELLYEIDQDVPLQIVGDCLRLRQVITNLVSNAMKFTSHGEVFVAVHLLQSDAEGRLELEFEVRDTGIGIPADKLERLFKAFSQIDSSTTRKYGGTGLGLAISEKLVKLMEGNISVNSQPGQGSTFIFTIKSHSTTKEANAYSQYNMSGQEGKNILVVDDNLTSLSILKNMLAQWKLKPVIANSGLAALEILKNNTQFSLVLTDMQMPGMNGLQLTHLIKAQYTHLPIILLNQVGIEADKNNLDFFISIVNKPIKQHDLNKQILNVLQGNGKIFLKEKTVQHQLSSDFSTIHPLSILIAEDNLINQKVILHILDKMGYKPEIVENGLEAVEAATKKCYDVILMDMQMPDMDGLEATRVIRRSLNKQPVIIALTANTIQGDREKCIQAGMNDFISKPIKLDELTNKLKKWSLHTTGLTHSLAG